MATTAVEEREIPREKIQTVEALEEYITSSEVVGIAKLKGIGATQIQRIRKLLSEDATLKVAKNTLMQIAINNSKDEKPNITKLEEYLTGSNIFIFADLDPFKLMRILERNKMKARAKAGNIAPEDIMIPAGNTGFPPGPLITEFGNVGLPTRIDAGQIAITKDTVVAKKGDAINRQLALVLSRLGIEPMEVGIELEIVYEDGVLLEKEDLEIDLEAITSQFKEAIAHARNLAINIGYPTPETIHVLLQKAFMNSMRLAEITSFITPETLPGLLVKANRHTLALASKIASIDSSVIPQELIPSTPTAPPPAEEKKPEVEEEKKPSEPEEEETEEGLGDLFG